MELDLITAIEMAKILKISKALSYRMLAEGAIPSVRFGKTVRIKPEDLQKFIDNSTSNTQQVQSDNSKVK
jgi:excisionase family DNA binding protein